MFLDSPIVPWHDEAISLKSKHQRLDQITELRQHLTHVGDFDDLCWFADRIDMDNG